MSKIEVDKVDPQSGTALEIGTSGDTITVPTGAGLTVVDEVKTNKISPATGVAFALGDSGDTFTIPSGATIVNSGTATGFGGGTNTPAFEAYVAASTTALPDNTAQKIEFDTEVYDTDGCYDKDTNYRFTPTTAGKYFVYSYLYLDSNADNMKEIGARIYKNGAEENRMLINFDSSYPGEGGSAITFSTIDFNGSSDYVEIYGIVDTVDNNDAEIYGDSSDRYTVFGAYRIIT
jgi:hypothetical protein